MHVGGGGGEGGRNIEKWGERGRKTEMERERDKREREREGRGIRIQMSYKLCICKHKTIQLTSFH